MGPSLAGYDLDTAAEQLEEAGFSYRTVGEGATVTGQLPSGGLSIPGGSTVVLYMGEEVPEDQVEMPNVVGMTPAKVKETLEELGLFVRITGVVDDYDSNITASSQSIDAGTKVERGTVVEVHFVSSVIDYGYQT